MRITKFAKKEDFNRKWLCIDATNKTLGRLATEIALRLQGKNKPMYTPHFDTGDFIIVINVKKIILTGNKWDQKTYYRHSGYPGGIKSILAKKQHEKNPNRLLYSAVKGMMPKNAMSRHSIRKLKLYAGDSHPHISQQPELLNL